MARSKEEITKLATSVILFAEQEFGEFVYEDWAEALKAILRARQDTFLLKRIGHLPNQDLLSLIKALRPIAGSILQSVDIEAGATNEKEQKQSKRGRPKALAGEGGTGK